MKTLNIANVSCSIRPLRFALIVSGICLSLPGAKGQTTTGPFGYYSTGLSFGYWFNSDNSNGIYYDTPGNAIVLRKSNNDAAFRLGVGAAKLNGSFYVVSALASGGSVVVNPGGSTYAGYIDWYKPGGSRIAYLGFQDLLGSAGNLGLNLENGAAFIVGGGSVGVGTTSFPLGEKLKVVGYQTIEYSAGPYLNWLQPSGALNQKYFRAGYNAGSFVLESVNDVYTTPTTRLLIDASGNVGIGTSSPTQKLSVNGTIRAKEVIVETTGWSDYVFEDGYRLQPLVEVRETIKREKHLPGIPSAAEITQNGIGLGEMQAKLLAKIEELTLHVISQEQRIQALEAENVALKGIPTEPKTPPTKSGEPQ